MWKFWKNKRKITKTNSNFIEEKKGKIFFKRKKSEVIHY